MIEFLTALGDDMVMIDDAVFGVIGAALVLIIAAFIGWMIKHHGRLSSLETDMKYVKKSISDMKPHIERLASLDIDMKYIKESTTNMKSDLKDINIIFSAMNLVSNNPDFIKTAKLIPAPHNPYNKKVKDDLLDKYQNKTITKYEAAQLKEILKEDMERINNGEVDVDSGAIGVGLLLLGVASYITLMELDHRDDHLT